MLLFYIFVLKDNRLNTDNNIPYWLMPVFFNQVLHKQLQFYHLSIGREYFLITPINTWIIFLNCNDGTSSTSQLQFYTIILSRLFLKSIDFFVQFLLKIFLTFQNVSFISGRVSNSTKVWDLIINEFYRLILQEIPFWEC